MSDPVNHPSHYTAGKVEVIDFIEQVVTKYVPSVAYHVGNCLKYLARAPLKGKLLEDLKKARWYLDRAIQVLERNSEPSLATPSSSPTAEEESWAKD